MGVEWGSNDDDVPGSLIVLAVAAAIVALLLLYITAHNEDRGIPEHHPTTTNAQEAP